MERGTNETTPYWEGVSLAIISARHFYEHPYCIDSNTV